MLEKLLERMKLVEEAVVKQTQAVQQAMADMNMLNGVKQELQHIINMAQEVAAVVEPVVEVVDAVGEVV